MSFLCHPHPMIVISFADRCHRARAMASVPESCGLNLVGVMTSLKNAVLKPFLAQKVVLNILVFLVSLVMRSRVCGS